MSSNQDTAPSLPILLKSSNVGICVKKLDREVLYQNDLCIKQCGALSGEQCQIGCMERYKAAKLPALSKGTQFFKAQKMLGALVDILVINDGEFLTTVFYPIDEARREILEALSEFGLSKREQDVVLSMVKGMKNEEIQQELFISSSTLKTHINKIYAKLPNHLRNDLKTHRLP